MSNFETYKFRRTIRHRYDYDNAMASTGNAFFAPDPTSGNYMEYHYHHMGRPGRRQVVDRVVKYKYPSKIGTNYQKEHGHYNSAKAVGRNNTGEPFNVEKEHKIINPHNVEKLTINRIDYQPFTIQPREPKKLKAPSPKQYVALKTAYQSEFQNWGPNEIIHEKDPQYPYYSLPFKGNSAYARTFCGGSSDGKTGRGVPFGLDALKQQQYNKNGGGMHGHSTGYGAQSGFGGNYPYTHSHMGKSSSNIRPLGGAGDLGDHFTTTHQRNFKDYQIKHRPQTCKPKTEAVKTLGNSKHFKTSHKNDFVPIPWRPLAVDMIPYP